MRTETPAVSCDTFQWGEEESNTPDMAADDAVRALRKRMTPTEDRYHNSPQTNN
jgi:hypothetical protein